MTRLLIVGDTHGDISFASKACRVAEKYEIATIIQVGDFGIWDHWPDGVNFLDQLDENAERRNVRWVFVPGNHENYDRLENYELVAMEQDLWTHEGFAPVRENILYTGKVGSWEWNGQTYKAVGGAVSIDKAYRKPGSSWWEQEQLTDEELQDAVDRGPADFLFTHDCPTYAPFGHRLKNDPDSQMHRQKMNQVVEATKAKVHFHGHMHSFYDYQNYDGGQIWGLECNDEAMFNYRGIYYDHGYHNMAIFDTVTLQTTWPNTHGV